MNGLDIFVCNQFMESMLAYLDHWKLTVQKRVGPFPAADRKQMMLSDITQNGMRITGTNQCGHKN